MCGRYRRTTSEDELARRYHIPIPPQRDLRTSWNIARIQDVLAIRLNPETKQRSLDAYGGLDPEFCYAHWGPAWSATETTRVTWNHPVLLASVGRRHRIQRFPYPVVWGDQHSARYREEELSPLEYRHQA